MEQLLQMRGFESGDGGAATCFTARTKIRMTGTNERSCLWLT
jgi:hypothetical protein